MTPQAINSSETEPVFKANPWLISLYNPGPILITETLGCFGGCVKALPYPAILVNADVPDMFAGAAAVIPSFCACFCADFFPLHATLNDLPASARFVHRTSLLGPRLIR